MNGIRNIADLVKEVLTESEGARNSDMKLYVELCMRLNPIAATMPFWTVLLNLKEHNLPNIETVRRTRQKLQAEFPELAACEKVAEMRAEKEEEFREYARG